MEGKKGLPHLFNDGKPSEMTDRDFFNFLNWLDKNDGIIDDSNASINEKLDGSSQFFGYEKGEKESFFWEKFGSNQRFYSLSEIPSYWEGYKQLFSDMESLLEDYLREQCDDTGANEIKVQIEVISSAGSNSDSSYTINLVPYKKSAFKEKGCLSIIQYLIDGENAPNEFKEKEDVCKVLENSGYTVFSGYSLENFSIDLSAQAMQVLELLDRYPFELESEKFGITLTEIEDIFDLPTRKYNQSTLRGLFSDAKESLAEEILNQLKDKAGTLSENGMFEGLAITLDNGMAFKVNSPEFKAAFKAHKQQAIARKLGKVSESIVSFTETKADAPEIVKGLKKANRKESILDDLKDKILQDLGIEDSDTIFAWSRSDANVINTSNPDGSSCRIPGAEVSEDTYKNYFVFTPHQRNGDRDYCTIYYFLNKSEKLVTLDSEYKYYYGVVHLHEHSSKRTATDDTKIQECLQGLACELTWKLGNPSIDELIVAIKNKIGEDFKNITFCDGRKIAVDNFDREKLEKYAAPAARTGMAFLEFFDDNFKVGAKVYHPDMEGPLKDVLDAGKKVIGGLKKDSWNPTDILITDFTSLKNELKDVKDVSELNNILKEYCLNNERCFIPLSLKLNLSKNRDSIVEAINLEDDKEEFLVSNHYVESNEVGNDINILATINRKPYKFSIRTNGSTKATIEGSHEDIDTYFLNKKYVDDTSENRNIVDREEVDIEAYKINEKDNTTSFLGKAKSVLFSAITPEKLKSAKSEISFDPKNRDSFSEGSLPWRLIELADKITNPEIKWPEKKNAKHNDARAKKVADCARDLAYLIVAAGWSTSEALIYLMTCSMKMNYGKFSAFAPLYKIS